VREAFRKFAKRCSETVGSPEVFLAAVVLIMVFHRPEHPESRRQSHSAEARCAHSCLQGARTGMVQLEKLSDEDLRSLTGDFERIRARFVKQGPSSGGPGFPSQQPTNPHYSG
jgi:hypothetical protein